MPAALNAEFKARCARLEGVQSTLESMGARFAGLDRQRDTYFAGAHGRLKLREGTVETALIHYHRADEKGVKTSVVTLYHPADARALRAVLTAAFAVDIVVEKTRAIYFVEHVKIHLDRVDGLGTFVEVEAIDTDGTRPRPALERDARRFKTLLGVADADLVAASYSDLLRQGQGR